MKGPAIDMAEFAEQGYRRPPLHPAMVVYLTLVAVGCAFIVAAPFIH